jgi:arginyl-tRNA synthetase
MVCALTTVSHGTFTGVDVSADGEGESSGDAEALGEAESDASGTEGDVAGFSPLPGAMHPLSTKATATPKPTTAILKLVVRVSISSFLSNHQRAVICNAAKWCVCCQIELLLVTPAELAAAIHAIVTEDLGRRGSAVTVTADEVALERPKNRDHGDWALNIAMKLAKPLGVNPRELASALLEPIGRIPGVSSVEIAGPGFINIRLDAAAAGALAKTIVEQGSEYGRNDTLAGQSINLEFVSANPTGPLHIGHTRWAALGDAIARVLTASGATMVSEFYINDAGNQMDNFGASIVAALQGEPTPENGYPGQYVVDLAERVTAQHPDILTLDRDALLALARETGYALQLADIRESLEKFNVHFDVWFSERTLHEPDASGTSPVEGAIDRLRAQGHVFDEEGAVWVRTTDFGDDKDRVIRRSNGVYTYFASDAAYYLNKGDRGFAHKIYLLGADHHGYVHRLKALAGAAGDDPETDIEILIGQLVSINGARLSKRAGNIIELDDLREWLGTDALRYSLARYPADSPLTLDPELLTKRTNDNPVFYVQYAHARTHQVARNASASGIDHSAFEPELLTHETENNLVGLLAEFPRIVAQAAQLREPHRVARYLEELAAGYHRWYDSCRVVPLGEEPVTDVHRTRLWLNDAAGVVLRNGLGLVGVSAPERM